VQKSSLNTQKQKFATQDKKKTNTGSKKDLDKLGGGQTIV
jgi:hypothetical protein